MLVCVYLNCAQFVLLSRVIVHHHDKIIANVSLFVAATLVALPVWHQCGYVKDSCRDTISFIICKLQTGCREKINIYCMCVFPDTHTHTHTLHDVVMPAVGELSIISILVKPSKENLVWIAVFQMD